MSKPNPFLQLHMTHTAHGRDIAFHTPPRSRLYLTIWYAGCGVLLILISLLIGFAAGATWERHNHPEPTTYHAN